MGDLEQARKTAREYPFTTTILPPDPTLRAGPEAFDAFYECEHYNLPVTPKELRAQDGCTCWDAKPVRQTEAVKSTGGPATPVAGKRVYQLDLPPFVEKVVREIDMEEERLIGDLERDLDRLQAVRSALTKPE